ncbi:MAG TPA: hypothetical protein VIQ29_00445 [Ancylobacter sp.]
MGAEYSEALRDNFPIFQADEYDFYFENMPWPIGLKSTHPTELKKRVAVAGISVVLGARSMDSIYKKYSKIFDYEEPNENRIDLQIQEFVRKKMDLVSDSVLRSSEREGTKFSAILAEWTLFRTPFSMQLAFYCANRGSLFESSAVSRSILEQVAWASYILSVDEGVEIPDVSATWCVGNLRKDVPAAGRLYGWMSNHAHWAFNAHRKAFTVDDGKLGHLFASCLFKAQSIAVILILIHILQKVCLKVVSYDAGNESIQAQELLGDDWLPEINRYMNEIKGCEPHSRDLAEVAGILQ